MEAMYTHRKNIETYWFNWLNHKLELEIAKDIFPETEHRQFIITSVKIPFPTWSPILLHVQTLCSTTPHQNDWTAPFLN